LTVNDRRAKNLTFLGQKKKAMGFQGLLINRHSLRLGTRPSFFLEKILK
jgi:hypothetical protein